jgi:hypothetical protein
VGGFFDKRLLLPDRGAPGKLLLLDDGVELICKWWDWGDRYWECLGDPVRMVGCLRGEKGESLAKEGRVRPKKDLTEARVVVGDGGIAVWIDRGVGARG